MGRGAVIVLALLLALVSAGAAGASPPDEPDWFVDEAALPFEALPGFEDATREWGVHRGAGYRIEVPADWNGSLVMWAHGYRGDTPELTVDNHPLRQYLIANGFAWAASSYSANGYDAGVGVVDTHRLVKLFRRRFDRPDTVYMTGASMGGHITARSIEQYPRAYDGAMPTCGVLGDYELFDWFLDFNLAAQQLGLGDSFFPVTDAETWFGSDVPAIKAGLEAADGGWPLQLNGDGEAFKQLAELRSGGDRPNFDEAWAYWNSIPSEAGDGNFLFSLIVGDGTIDDERGTGYDNIGVTYQLDLDPALDRRERHFNARIERVRRAPWQQWSRRLDEVPIITGRIRTPVLSLHNLGDLFVPFHNEVVYAREVARHGDSDLLVQRAIRGVGHCDFTPAELVTAFSDLVTWVETGQRPAGDVVLDPDAVAADDYGCRFTDLATPGGHTAAAPCP